MEKREKTVVMLVALALVNLATILGLAYVVCAQNRANEMHARHHKQMKGAVEELERRVDKKLAEVEHRITRHTQITDRLTFRMQKELDAMEKRLWQREAR